MGRETGSLQLFAPLLLTGGKGVYLVIRGNVVLNNIKNSSFWPPDAKGGGEGGIAGSQRQVPPVPH
jgi:hypothetical protein